MNIPREERETDADHTDESLNCDGIILWKIFGLSSGEHAIVAKVVVGWGYLVLEIRQSPA
jgi:hypothetical protein